MFAITQVCVTQDCVTQGCVSQKQHHRLFEQGFYKGRDVVHLYRFYALRDLRFFKTTVGGDEDTAKAQAGGFAYAAVRLIDWAYLPAQAHFACEAHIGRDGEIEIGGENGAYHGKVAGGIRDAQASCHIQEHVFGGEVETRTLLQHRKQHIQASHVKPCR